MRPPSPRRRRGRTRWHGPGDGRARRLLPPPAVAGEPANAEALRSCSHNTGVVPRECRFGPTMASWISHPSAIDVRRTRHLGLRVTTIGRTTASGEGVEKRSTLRVRQMPTRDGEKVLKLGAAAYDEGP